MSKFHFLRSFAVTYQVTPLAYLAERRIERAQDEGGLPGVGLHVKDCHATYEARMRDNSGSWMVLVEPRDYTPEDFAGVDRS